MPPAGLGEASVVLVWLVRLKMVLNTLKIRIFSLKRRWLSGRIPACDAIGPGFENC